MEHVAVLQLVPVAWRSCCERSEDAPAARPISPGVPIAQQLVRDQKLPMMSVKLLNALSKGRVPCVEQDRPAQPAVQQPDARNPRARSLREGRTAPSLFPVLSWSSRYQQAGAADVRGRQPLSPPASPYSLSLPVSAQPCGAASQPPARRAP